MIKINLTKDCSYWDYVGEDGECYICEKFVQTIFNRKPRRVTLILSPARFKGGRKATYHYNHVILKWYNNGGATWIYRALTTVLESMVKRGETFYWSIIEND